MVQSTQIQCHLGKKFSLLISFHKYPIFPHKPPKEMKKRNKSEPPYSLYTLGFQEE